MVILKMKDFIKLFILLFILSTTSISCSTEAPDGLTYRSPNRSERFGSKKITFFVEIQDDNGRKIPNVLISAKNTRNSDKDLSDISGRATLSLRVSRNEALEFYFKSKDFEYTKVVSSIPYRQKEINYIFKVDNRGSVRLTEVSY